MEAHERERVLRSSSQSVANVSRTVVVYAVCAYRRVVAVSTVTRAETLQVPAQTKVLPQPVSRRVMQVAAVMYRRDGVPYLAFGFVATGCGR